MGVTGLSDQTDQSKPFHPKLTVGDLVEGTRLELALEYLAGAAGSGRVISQPRVQKPGLALAGFMEYLHRGRVQILGNSEITFLHQLEPQQRRSVVHSLVGYGVSCFAITKGLTPPPELVREADAASSPLLRTKVVSSAAIYAIGRFLEEKLAPTVQIHGVLMDVYGLGVLLLGDSGVGKSECALDLIVRGHRIVSDDVVVVRRQGRVLTGSSPEMTRYHMELRGIGIVNVKDLFGVAAVRFTKDIDLVVRLDGWQEGKAYERLGVEDRTYGLLGQELPYVEMPVAPGRHLSVLVEVTARNHLLKLKGYHPARSLAGALDRRIQQGSETPARPARETSDESEADG
jgi:HPr kinase/phosphorylase